VVDVLNEAGGAQGVGLVEYLVADAAAARQPGLGELHADAQHLVLRHQHARPVVLELERDAAPLQILHDGCRILHRQVGEERRHVRRRDAQHQEGEKADQRDRDRGHRRKPRRPERLHEGREPLHRSSPETRNEPN
jgi:hypothetical protein